MVTVTEGLGTQTVYRVGGEEEPGRAGGGLEQLALELRGRFPGRGGAAHFSGAGLLAPLAALSTPSYTTYIP